MVRAATWLHFGSGGAAGARVSTTVTSMPRHARSIASVSPTGPAPTIRTSGSFMAGYHAWHAWFEHSDMLLSFELGAGVLDDDSPALDFGLDVSRKTVRCRWRQRLQRDRRQFVARRRDRPSACRSAPPTRRRSAAACPPAPPRPARRPVQSREARLRRGSECRARPRPASAWSRRAPSPCPRGSAAAPAAGPPP